MSNILTELKRRNVFRVAAAYTVVAWIIAQAFDLGVDNFGAPDWVMKVLLSILIAGLPVALLLAWAFELTPDGVVKTENVPASESITPRTGKTLNRITTAALVLVLAFVAWDKLGPGGESTSSADTKPSVAVLPFADLSELQDQEWFADGLTEEILNALARLPELRVTARTSSFEFKNTNTNIAEIASKLGVAHVVEGSVRRIGNNLRVTAQLIRASDGFHLWSDTYDRNTEDLFDVQRDVAENIATALDVILDDEKRDRMLASGTRNVEVHHQAPGDVGIAAGLAAIEIGSERYEARTRQTVTDIANMIDEPPPLLDDEDAGPAAARGPREIAARLAALASGNSLYRNDGGGKFTNVTETAGPFFGGWSWGGGFIDIDNDGFEDLYTPNGHLSGTSEADT